MATIKELKAALRDAGYEGSWGKMKLADYEKLLAEMMAEPEPTPEPEPEPVEKTDTAPNATGGDEQRLSAPRVIEKATSTLHVDLDRKITVSYNHMTDEDIAFVLAERGVELPDYAGREDGERALLESEPYHRVARSD